MRKVNQLKKKKKEWKQRSNLSSVLSVLTKRKQGEKIIELVQIHYRYSSTVLGVDISRKHVLLSDISDKFINTTLRRSVSNRF